MSRGSGALDGYGHYRKSTKSSAERLIGEASIQTLERLLSLMPCLVIFSDNRGLPALISSFAAGEKWGSNQTIAVCLQGHQLQWA